MITGKQQHFGNSFLAADAVRRMMPGTTNAGPIGYGDALRDFAKDANAQGVTLKPGMNYSSGGGAGSVSGAATASGMGGIDLTDVQSQQPAMSAPSMQALGSRDSGSSNVIERPPRGGNMALGMRARPQSMRYLQARAY